MEITPGVIQRVIRDSHTLLGNALEAVPKRELSADDIWTLPVQQARMRVGGMIGSLERSRLAMPELFSDMPETLASRWSSSIDDARSAARGLRDEDGQDLTPLRRFADFAGEIADHLDTRASEAIR
jgi:hypothetical protein